MAGDRPASRLHCIATIAAAGGLRSAVGDTSPKQRAGRIFPAARVSAGLLGVREGLPCLRSHGSIEHFLPAHHIAGCSWCGSFYTAYTAAVRAAAIPPRTPRKRQQAKTRRPRIDSEESRFDPGRLRNRAHPGAKMLDPAILSGDPEIDRRVARDMSE